MSKNQVALFEDELAKMAMESVKAEQSGLGATFLSTKSGVMTYRGNPITNNKLQCVILNAPIERLYYDTRYDPTKLVGPKCFGIATLATGMRPSDRAEGKQHDTCEGCPKNEWGSATNGGKGKACRETRRMLLIPADSIDTPEAVKAAEVAALRPPVTSLKNYANYVQTVAMTLKRPPVAVITEIAVVPDAKTQFKVTFTLIKAIENGDVIRALMERAEAETQRAIDTVGVVVDEESEQAAAPATSNKY
jgi:hypothetical protein